MPQSVMSQTTESQALYVRSLRDLVPGAVVAEETLGRMLYTGKVTNAKCDGVEYAFLRRSFGDTLETMRLDESQIGILCGELVFSGDCHGIPIHFGTPYKEARKKLVEVGL